MPSLNNSMDFATFDASIFLYLSILDYFGMLF